MKTKLAIDISDEMESAALLLSELNKRSSLMPDVVSREVGRLWYLLGQAEDRLNLLGTWGEEEDVEFIRYLIEAQGMLNEAATIALEKQLF